MDILIILLLLICLWRCKFSFSGHPDYISRTQTDSIKGIFAIIILYSHMRGYLDGSEAVWSRGIYDLVISILGQSMVVMFLLYSGYGIMEALKRDRQKYTDTFVKRRLLKTWFVFAIAVSMFFALNAILGITRDPINYITCWIGYGSIGNSNWFVFDILMLYVLTYFGLLVARWWNFTNKKIVLTIYIYTFIFLGMLIAAGKEAYWYDTVLAYPTGMLYSLYKEKIERAVEGWRWIAATAILFLAFFFCRLKAESLINELSGPLYTVAILFLTISTTIVFALFLVLLTMKLKIDNKVLRWLGTNAFAIYILQRLAMILGEYLEWNNRDMIFAAFVIPATLIIAAIFTAATNKINKRLFY